MMRYSDTHCKLILSMNNLNIFTTLFIFIKHGLFTAIPHLMVCVTSILFWSNPMDKTLMYIDYTFVFNSILFSYINSFIYGREHYITPLLFCVFYSYFFSIHFKNINDEKLSIYCHTATYLIGNIGTVLIFA